MVAYNFQARFAGLVRSHEKCQTIRSIGKRRHARVGEKIQLYTGMRTKNCVKLIDPDTDCISVSNFRLWIDDDGQVQMWAGGGPVFPLSGMDREHLAKADGFEDSEEMWRWFADTHGLPFSGVLIKWSVVGQFERY